MHCPTKVRTRKHTVTLSLSLYKTVMYLECSPFLEEERDGGGPIAPTCPFVAFFILPWLAGNEYLFTVTGVKKMKWFLSLTRSISSHE